MSVRFSSRLVFLLGLLLSFIFQKGACQDFSPSVFALSIEDGLSQNTVIDVLHDHHGFMWIATQDGLNRFDGYTFNVFKSSSRDTSTLSNNHVKSLELDRHGNIWLGTQLGLCKYDIKKSSFTRYLKEDFPYGFNHSINDVLIKNDGIWLATNEGILHAEDLSQPDFKFYPAFDQSNHVLQINRLIYLKEGFFLLATDRGLFRFHPTSLGFDSVNLQQKQQEISALAYEDGKVWVGTPNGLFSFKTYQLVKGSDGQLKVYRAKQYQALAGKQVHSIFKDSSEKIWVGTNAQGVFHLDTKTDSGFEIYRDAENQFCKATVISIFEDTSRNLWLGTLESGLFQIKSTNRVFKLIRKGLNSMAVRGLYEKDGLLWVCTANGINVVDKSNSSFVSLKCNPGSPGSLSHNDVKSLTLTSDGNSWIATNNGLNKLNTTSFKVSHFYASDENPLILNNKVRAVTQLSDGNLWVGTLGGGINVIDPEKDQLVATYQSIPEDETSLPDNHVMNIFESADQTIWVATYGGGLCKLNQSDHSFTSVRYHELPLLLTSINEDEDGTLWVGTYGDGFYQLDPNTLEYILYTEEDGLSNNVTYAVIPYGNDLWVSTNHGINKYDRALQTFTVFNENDGVQSNEFSTGSYFKAEDGQLYFGGVGGVSFFHPDSISGHLFVPKPAFTDFKIFNRSVHPNQVIIGGKAPLQESISDSVTVNLSHFHNSFTIGFASLDYSNPEDSRYTYRLVGFDSKWNPVDARQRAITYTNLEPDDYVFQVRASNDDGVWNSQPITLFISITPSLLDHTGFKISVVIACALLISFIMFKRVKRSRSHKKFLESEINERTREISEQNELLSQSETYLRNLNKKKDQMFYILTHNVRAPLTTLVGLLKSKTDEDLTDERYNRLLDDLQHQVRDSLLLLDNAFYWSLIQFERIPEKREQVALNGLINQQIHKYNRYASFKNIRINFQCGEELIIDCDQLMTSIIIQNLISNAIKYSHNGGAVNVRFEKGETSSSVVVEDFGIGLTKAEIHSIFNREENVSTHGSQKEKGTGLGLMISQIFAEKMGFKLKVESEKGSYSRFYLDVPHAGGT